MTNVTLFSEKLHAEMTAELYDLRTAETNELQLAERSFHIIETHIMKLKQFIIGYEFISDREEIRFFKSIKPSFHKELIYYVELVHMESNKPRGCSTKSLISYYHNIAERMRLYFLKQQSLYLYFKTERSTEDELLFLRQGDCIPMIPQDSVDMDSQFSTVASSIMARIMAFEMALDYIDDRVQQLERPQIHEIQQKQGRLNWTDPKTDLIELVYALHSRGSINHGKCDIKELVAFVESTLNVQLGNFYRAFQNMRIRKKTRTPYLDQLKTSLEKRMDESDLAF